MYSGVVEVCVTCRQRGRLSYYSVSVYGESIQTVMCGCCHDICPCSWKPEAHLCASAFQLSRFLLKLAVLYLLLFYVFCLHFSIFNCSVVYKGAVHNN